MSVESASSSPTLKYPGVRELVQGLVPRMKEGWKLGDAEDIFRKVGDAMKAQGILQTSKRTSAGVDIPDTPVGQIAVVLRENPELGHLFYNEWGFGLFSSHDYTADISGQMADRLLKEKSELMGKILKAFGFDGSLAAIKQSIEGYEANKTYADDAARNQVVERRMQQILANWLDLLLIREVGINLMKSVGFDSMHPEEDPRAAVKGQVGKVLG